MNKSEQELREKIADLELQFVSGERFLIGELTVDSFNSLLEFINRIVKQGETKTNGDLNHGEK